MTSPLAQPGGSMTSVQTDVDGAALKLSKGTSVTSGTGCIVGLGTECGLSEAQESNA